MVLHIESAASPDEFAVINTVKRRVSPVLLGAGGNGNNVLVGKQGNAVKVAAFALPAVNKVRRRNNGFFKVLCNKGIRFVKELVELFKFVPVNKLGLPV